MAEKEFAIPSLPHFELGIQGGDSTASRTLASNMADPGLIPGMIPGSVLKDHHS